MSSVPRVATGDGIVNYIIPLLASYLGVALVQWALSLSDQIVLLVLLTVNVLLLMTALKRGVEWWALHNDGRVDGHEHVWIYVIELLSLVLFLMLPPYLYQYITRALADYTLPVWYELLPLGALTIVLLLAVLPSIFAAVFATVSNLAPSGGGGDDEGTEPRKTSGSSNSSGPVVAAASATAATTSTPAAAHMTSSYPLLMLSS